MASPLVLLLILAAAAAHAGWNLFAKRGAGGAAFVWLAAVIGTALYLPALVVAVALTGASAADLAWVAVASGVLHLAYFVLLQRAYAGGDLSLVYPLARGTAPVLAAAGAIVVLGERPSALAVAGAALIAAAVLLLAGGSASGLREAGWRGLAFALGTGGAVAVYTLVDKHAVGTLALSPVVYCWATNAVVVVALTPVVLRRGSELRAAWGARRAALGVGVLSPVAYTGILYALVEAPVTYVAPVRETSILMTVALGAAVLGEGDVRRRAVAGGVILIGVVALTLG